MEIDVILNMISTVGFPIFVAVWLLWRTERTEKRTQEILIEVKTLVKQLCDRVKM